MTYTYNENLQCEDCGLQWGTIKPYESSVCKRVAGYVACNDCARKRARATLPTVQQKFAVAKHDPDNEYVQLPQQPVGMKHDSGKTRYDLQPRQVFAGIASVLTFGAAKYEPYGWQRVELTRYLSAAERHLISALSGESTDAESGLLHAWHYATNAIFIAWLLVNKPEQARAYRAQQDGAAPGPAEKFSAKVSTLRSEDV